MGNSLVEDDTRRAVDTELGLVYWGRMPRRLRGEKADDVRKRMLIWNAAVERAQKTTISRVSS
jgi:hypothetical protein